MISPRGSLDIDEELTIPRMAGADQQGLKLLREAWEALGRQIQTTLECGAEDRRTRRLNDTFVRTLQEAVERLTWVCLRFDNTRVHLRGKILVEGEIWSRLYDIGVRGVSIETTDAAELSRLGDLLSRNWSRRDRFDADLRRELWRGGLRGCWLDVRAAPEAENADHAFDRLSGLTQLFERLQGGLPELPEDSLSDAGRDVLVRLRRDLAHEAPEMGGMNDLIDVMQSHEALLRREVATIAAGADISPDSVGRVVFELALLLPGQGAEQLGREMARLVRQLWRSQDTDAASALVRRAALLLDDEPMQEHPSLRRLRDGMATLLDHPEALGAELDALPEDESAAVLSVLLAMPPHAGQALAAVCAASASPAWRMVLADALVLLSGDAVVGRLSDLLEHSQGRDAMLPLLGLARVDVPQSIGPCLDFLQATDSDLREAALVALRRHGSERVRRAVLAALRDRSAKVRTEALRWVSVYQTREALPQLTDQVRGGNWFVKSNAKESRAWLMAYARTAGTDAVPLLLGILDGSHPLPTRPPELVLSAARAALATGSREVAPALERLARQREDVRRALSELNRERQR